MIGLRVKEGTTDSVEISMFELMTERDLQSGVGQSDMLTVR
jgi:hypothetical protein